MAVSYNSGKKKAKNTELRQKLCVGLGFITIICIIFMVALDASNKAAQKNVNTLYDTTVIDYEAYAAELNTLVEIYSIWDDDSYQYAMNNCKVAGTLRNIVFPTDTYKGNNYKQKPSVKITDIQYSLEPTIDNTRTYYCVMEVTNKDTGLINLYSIIATLQDDMLVDYRVI